MVLFLVPGRGFSVLQRAQTGYGMSPVGGGCERPGHKHLPPSSAEVKDEWNYTSTNMYVHVYASMVSSEETAFSLPL